MEADFFVMKMKCLPIYLKHLLNSKEIKWPAWKKQVATWN